MLFIITLLLLGGSFLQASEGVLTRTVSTVNLSMGDTSGLSTQERKQCDDYCAYWKRLEERHRNSNRINASLTLRGLQGAVPGGISALAHLRNQERSITLISALSNPTADWHSTDIFAEELTKSLLLPYFSVWSQGEDPVLFYIDRFHEQEFDFIYELANLEAFVRVFYSKKVPNISPTLELLVRTVAENFCKEEEALRFGSLNFEASNRVRDRLIARGRLPFVNSAAAAALSDTNRKLTAICCFFLQLELQFKQSPIREQLSEEGSSAETLVRKILHKRRNLTLGAYVGLFKDNIVDFEKAGESAPNQFLKSKIKQETEELRLLTEQLHALFAAQKSEWHALTIEQFMLNIAKEIHSGHELILRLFKLITYIHSVSKIMEWTMLVELLEQYKHCVVFARDLSEETLKFLQEMGFKGDVHGVIARPGEMVANQGTPFNATEIVAFLDVVSKTINANYTPVTDPRLFHQINPFLEFVEDPFLPDEIRIQNQVALTLGKTTRYVNLFTKEVSDTPYLDDTQVSCAGCDKKLSRFRAVTTCADAQTLCSTNCFAHWLCKQGAVPELLAKSVISKEDKKALQQLAALCALRYLTLSPHSRSCQSLFFSIKHARLKDLLMVLIKKGGSHPLWITTFKLTEAFLIDLRNLSVFCELYRNLKNEYLQELLAQAKKRRYKDLEHESGIHFDPQDYVYKYQEKQYETLRSHWKLSSSTSLELLPTLYLEILKLISSKVPFSFDLLEQYLELGDEAVVEEKIKVVRPSLRPALRRVPQQKSIKKTEETALPVEETETFETLDELFDEELSSQAIAVDIPAENNNFIPQAAENNILHSLPVIRSKEIGYIDFECLFAQTIPYNIRLYDVSLLVPEEEQTGIVLWRRCKKMRESIRLQTLRALSESLDQAPSISRTEYGTYLLRCDDDTYDATIKDKLDLHHLFPQKIDRYLQRNGVVELLEGLIQLSLPGTISYNDGTVEKGFFQLTYIPETWICIHRCFKVWNHQKSKYISPLLAGLIEQVIH